MKKLFAIFLGLFLLAPAIAANAATGVVKGGQNHRAPDWFKESFLDLKDDAAEAAGAGKHTMIFFDLDGCPYCARMMAESVGPQRALIEPYFDSIALDVKGSREVSLDGQNSMEERELAKKLHVRFTPTIIFLDGDAKPVFRINGFWNPTQFRIALKYVRTNAYKKMSILAFAKQQKTKPVYSLRKHELLTDVSDFSKLKTPTLVLFEDKSCSACAELHDSVLNRKDMLVQLKKFTFTRLDPTSDKEIIDFDGNKTTQAKWAAKLNVETSPTFIAFDEAKEVQRVTSTLYSFHFSSILEYVSGKHYKNEPNWLRYMGKRNARIRAAGKDVDLSKNAKELIE